MIKNNIINELNNFQFESAAIIANSINKLLETNDIINIGLSGGSTPLPVMYLVKDHKIEFKKINFFIVDERNVNNNSYDSNYYNLNHSFFKYIDSNVFCYDDEISKELSVINYENTILSKLPESNQLPKFDLIVLGMGLDGHTASIFPNSAAENELEKLVFLNYVDKLNSYRKTFTYPLILNANKILVLIQGVEKIKLFNNLSVAHPIKKIIDEANNINILCSKI
jgi:6-phosphogluconolactonase